MSQIYEHIINYRMFGNTSYKHN